MSRIMEALKEEEGATMVEYALMLALIAIICLAAVQFIGKAAKNTFQASGDAVNGTVPVVVP
ncbi:MAG: Flp family type IVb pilin [Armatimonadota bacterium]|nr:Flp family type IVb pilin [Armatimonadota bacterium]